VRSASRSRGPWLAAAAALLAVGAITATAQGQGERRGIRGGFSLVQMVHTSSATFGQLPGVSPWSGQRRGTFGYRSIPCSGNAPVNNLSSDLPSYNTRIRGSRVPASVRSHPFRFQVRGNRMRGRITLVVCKLAAGPTAQNDPVPDAQKPKIRVRFVARWVRHTAQEISFRGSFRLVGGTQRYAGLTGTGQIAGYFACFESSAGPGCQDGRYLDGQYTMQGRYRDPTPRL
jgi:hypothetical protein